MPLPFHVRLQPDEWESPHPCDEDPEEVENVWDIPNSTWLTTGSLLAQGCDLLPKYVNILKFKINIYDK